MSFITKIMEFMQGRYGFDTLNKFLLGTTITISFASFFVFNFWARLIMFAIELALLGWFAFRFLSRNITGRSHENRIFEKFFNPVKNFFVLTYKKIRDRKDYRYIKCPACKAQLRVKNKKGMHTVRCPKCSNEFKKKI
jgi:predicted Zn finger-like uncharacterized protein